MASFLTWSTLVTAAFLSSMAHSLAMPGGGGSKPVLVTGANKGIGSAICKRLLEEHPTVQILLGSRDLARGKEAAESLAAEGDASFRDRIDVVQIDTASDESVRRCAEEVTQGGTKKLYGIVNNAGIIGKGFDDTLGVNYFGVRRVNDAFIPSLVRPGGRIVNIASASGPMFVASCGVPDLKAKLADPSSIEGGIAGVDEIAKSYLGMTDYGNDAYGVSKALVNAYTALLAKEEPDLIVNSCSPGFIKTDMGAPLGATNPPEMGSLAPVALLMSADFEGIPTGRYYGSDAVRSPLDRYRGPGDPPYEGP